MTAPRQIIPAQRYLITRRCTQRQFLLRPSRITNQTVKYCLALAAEHTGVLLHAACFMSNHWHGVVTDPEARLPEFLERFHRLVAKAQNASLGRWENLWSSDKASAVLLVSDADVLEKMAYTIANPTVAGLVRSPHEWPGVISHRLNESESIEMPDIFFDDEGELPDEVRLEFVRPAIFAGMSDTELSARFRDAVGVRVRRTGQAEPRLALSRPQRGTAPSFFRRAENTRATQKPTSPHRVEVDARAHSRDPANGLVRKRVLRSPPELARREPQRHVPGWDVRAENSRGRRVRSGAVERRRAQRKCV